jgi:hypothetical protein
MWTVVCQVTSEGSHVNPITLVTHTPPSPANAGPGEVLCTEVDVRYIQVCSAHDGGGLRLLDERYVIQTLAILG